MGLRRNDRRDVALFELLKERVGVVALVGNRGVGREVFKQRLGLRYIMNLPGRERERDWIAERDMALVAGQELLDLVPLVVAQGDGACVGLPIAEAP